MRLKKKEVKHILQNLNTLQYYIVKGKLNEVVSDGEYLYFTETKGKCNPKKCKAACCRVCALNNWNQKFVKNFADIKTNTLATTYYVKKKCKQLDKNNRCKIHGRSTQSLACKMFPSITDHLYLMHYDKCTKYIDVVKKIKISGLIRDEKVKK